MAKYLHNIGLSILEAAGNDVEVRTLLEGFSLSNLKENGDSLVYALKNKITKFFSEDQYSDLYYTKGNIAALKEFPELKHLIKNMLAPKIEAGEIAEEYTEVVKAFDNLYNYRNQIQTAVKNNNELVMLVYFSILHAVIVGATDAILCRKSGERLKPSLYYNALVRFNSTVKNGSFDSILKQTGDYFVGGTMLISGIILFLLLGLKDATYYFYSLRVSITENLSYLKEAVELNQEVTSDKGINKKQKDIASKLSKVIEKIKVEDVEAEKKATKLKVADNSEFKQEYSGRKELLDLL